MKPLTARLIFLAALIVVGLALVTLMTVAPKHPVALIRVVDAAGKPVAGAVIQPEGLRTKPGPYVSGWYGWSAKDNAVPNPPVTTAPDGCAHVPYPKYVFEKIETGTLCLSVNHPDYVPDRPERLVATTPPAGAPLRAWATHLWNRIQHKALIARPEPVVLQKGAVLKLTVRADAHTPTDARLFAQVARLSPEDTNIWSRPEPGVIVTRRLAAGTHAVRAVELDAENVVWFSDVTAITAVTSQTNELVVTLKRGITVHGQLDDTVPRPVTNGRVVAHVWPPGAVPGSETAQWHAWTTVQEDGSFVISSLPTGTLEIIALCNGFVSTNGPGKYSFHYPQQHQLGTNDLHITLGMEPTARLEVKVTDESGHPLKGVRVMTSPNVRYGEWSATILACDRYNTADWLRVKPDEKSLWREPVPDFQGVSDSNGLAVLPNLPGETRELAVEHPQFALPAISTASGGKRRQASFVLMAGQTNRLSLQLEPRDRSAITHY